MSGVYHSLAQRVDRDSPYGILPTAESWTKRPSPDEAAELRRELERLMLIDYLPLVVFLAVAVGFAALLLIVAWTLGPKRPSPEKNIPYECGMEPLGRPRSRFNVQFYRIAILFIVFDIEAAFFYPWAVMFRELSCRGAIQNGICQGGATAFGLLVMLVFLMILVLALLYVWRRKALEWE
jgi:NADH-quinone oxidoreductase subunit A